MSLVVRVLIFVPVVFLILVVYAGQHEKDGPSALRAAAKKTPGFLLWSAVLVVIMEVLQWLLLP